MEDISSKLSHFPCVLQLQPVATVLPIGACQEIGLVANASVAFQRLSWDISSKTNNVRSHRYLFENWLCLCCVGFFFFLEKSSRQLSDRNGTCFCSFWEQWHVKCWMCSYSQVSFHYHLTICSPSLILSSTFHLSLDNFFSPSIHSLTLILSLQWRLPMWGYESSRYLWELWHGLPYLVSSLHGRQLEWHHEGIALTSTGYSFSQTSLICKVSTS